LNKFECVILAICSGLMVSLFEVILGETFHDLPLLIPRISRGCMIPPSSLEYQDHILNGFDQIWIHNLNNMPWVDGSTIWVDPRKILVDLPLFPRIFRWRVAQPLVTIVVREWLDRIWALDLWPPYVIVRVLDVNSIWSIWNIQCLE